MKSFFFILLFITCSISAMQKTITKQDKQKVFKLLENIGMTTQKISQENDVEQIIASHQYEIRSLIRRMNVLINKYPNDKNIQGLERTHNHMRMALESLND